MTSHRKHGIKSHMMTITDRDYRDILDTVYTVNCCEDKESFLDALMPSMMDMFHADCVTFQLIQGYPSNIKVVESRSFKSEKHNLNEDKFYPDLYRENYYQQSPLLKEAVSSSKIILKFGESITLSDWEQSDLYNNFIAPQNLYWEMFLTLRWKNNLEGMITIWRSKDQGNYAGLDILKAEVIAPHLMAAVRNTLARSKITRPDFSIANDLNTDGLLLLDHRMNPLYFNSSARRICLQVNNHDLSSAPNPDTGEFSIPDCIIQDCSYLLELLKCKEHPVLWPRERSIFKDNQLKFRTECSLIRKSGQFDFRPRFVVILSEISNDQSPGINAQRKFKISSRELDIIYYLNQGLSYEEIGLKLFISKQTVHTHIKNIYRKLGAKNRIDLYRYAQSPICLE